MLLTQLERTLGGRKYFLYGCILRRNIVTTAIQKKKKEKINLDEPEYGVGSEGKYKFSVSNAFYGMRGAREPRKEILDDKDLDYLTNAGYFETDKFESRRGHAVWASIVVFMVYFFYLREENDWDQRIYRPLYVSLPDIEKQVIRDKIKTEHKLGHDTTELEKEVEDLEDEKDKLVRRWKRESTTYPKWMKPTFQQP